MLIIFEEATWFIMHTRQFRLRAYVYEQRRVKIYLIVQCSYIL